MNNHRPLPENRSGEDPEKRPWQPRFSILGMLLLTLVACMMAASASYLLPALRGQRHQQFIFVLVTIASPLLVMVVVSVAARRLRWSRRRRDP